MIVKERIEDLKRKRKKVMQAKNYHHLLLFHLPPKTHLRECVSVKKNYDKQKSSDHSRDCSTIAYLSSIHQLNLFFKMWSRYVERYQKIPCLKRRSSSFSSIFFSRSRRVKLYLVINTSKSDCDCGSIRL